MPQHAVRAAEHHEKAAEHHDKAAEHHRQAAKHHEGASTQTPAFMRISPTPTIFTPRVTPKRLPRRMRHTTPRPLSKRRRYASRPHPLGRFNQPAQPSGPIPVTEV
jgi:hypothetical protein